MNKNRVKFICSFIFLFYLIFFNTDSSPAVTHTENKQAINEVSLSLNAALQNEETDKIFQTNTIDQKQGSEVNLTQDNPASTDIKDEKIDTPLGMSYKSNENALNAIQKNINLFTDRLRERFSVWLERSAKYIDIMKDILIEKGLPEDLVFLPIIESGFNPNAYSPARAVGPWQFISSTARRYGLVIDWWRDERKDPVKATRAAADYLADLYGMFGSWKLALAAYNAGEGRIGRAIKSANTTDFWHLKAAQKIPKETQEYVPRYIAATLIASNPEEYGFYDLDYHSPILYEEVVIDSPVDIDILAMCAETTVSEIRELNPELRRWSTPPNVREYIVKIPFGKKDVFIKNLKDIPLEKRFSVDIYTVKKGDTIKKIAKKTGFPVNVIIAMNSLSGIERLKAGEKIKIPPKGKYYPDKDDIISVKRSYKNKKTYKASGRYKKKATVRAKKA